MRWLILDFDNVISPTHYWFDASLGEVAKERRLDTKKAVLFLCRHMPQWFRNTWNTSTTLDRMGRHLHQTIPLRLFREKLKGTLRPQPEVLRAVAALRKRGVKVAVLTDSPAIRIRLMRTLLKGKFDHITGSGFLGHMKRDQRCFRKLCARLRAKPGDCLLVDDLELNCASARKAGLQALRFSIAERPARELAARLRSLRE